MLKLFFSVCVLLITFFIFTNDAYAQSCAGTGGQIVACGEAYPTTLCPSNECGTRCPSNPNKWYDYAYVWDCASGLPCDQDEATATCSYLRFWTNSQCAQEYPSCGSNGFGCGTGLYTSQCTGENSFCIAGGSSPNQVCSHSYNPPESGGVCVVVDNCGWDCQAWGGYKGGCYEKEPGVLYWQGNYGPYNNQAQCLSQCENAPNAQCGQSCNQSSYASQDQKCASGLICDSDGPGTPTVCQIPSCTEGVNCPCGGSSGGCGASGQACCSPDNSCDSGLSCSSGVCGSAPGPGPDPGPGPSCGTSGQACCSGSSCNSGLTCQGGVCANPPSCGSAGQNCCPGNACNAGLVCSGGSSGACYVDSCGAQGERCCGSSDGIGGTCDGGLACTATGFCGAPAACNASCNSNADCPSGYECFNDQGKKCRLSSCPANSNCACDPPQQGACSVTASPNPLVMTGVGTQQSLTASVTVGYGAVKLIEFATTNGGIVTANPQYHYGPAPFTTTVTANGAGNAVMRVWVYMESPGIEGYHIRCTTEVNTQVLNIPAWWQASDADIFATGDIRSQIPSTCSGGSCTPQLVLPGDGGYSGIPAYSGSAVYGSGTVSSSGWNANTSYAGRRYDYDWYRSLTESNTEIVNCSGGCNLNSSDINAKAGDDKVNIVIYEGNVTLTNNINMNNKKVAIFVNGNLNINDRILLNDGSGFFAAFVKGNIVVNPSVTHPNQPSVEGLLISDGSFSTGAGSSRYYHRGSVVAWGGVSLLRDLASQNQQNPAELFEYAPDLILNFPPQLFRDGVVWREVAP